MRPATPILDTAREDWLHLVLAPVWALALGLALGLTPLSRWKLSAFGLSDSPVDAFLGASAAATNDRYSDDGSDLPEFYFDDRSIAKLEKRLKPHQDAAASVAKANVEATPSAGAKSVAPDRSKDCAALTKILASKDDIAAQHGAQKAAQVMVAARKRFEEYECR